MKLPHRRKFLRLAAGVAALPAVLVAMGPVRAQPYPNKPIRLIVPFPAGGAADVAARIVTQALS